MSNNDASIVTGVIHKLDRRRVVDNIIDMPRRKFLTLEFEKNQLDSSGIFDRIPTFDRQRDGTIASNALAWRRSVKNWT